MTEQEQISLQDAFKIQNQRLRKAIETIKEDKELITELIRIINNKSNSKFTIDKSKITDVTDEQLNKYKSYI